MKFFITTLLVFFAGFLQASSKHEVSFGTAYAWNAYTRIIIRQGDFPKDGFTPRCKTKSFEGSPYYQFRYTYWKSPCFGLGAEFIHHKIYVVGNKPDYVQEFTITNGFNLLYCNQSFKLFENASSKLSFILGEGIVITHPESRIRGNPFDEKGGLRWIDTDGYFVGGLTAQTVLNCSFNLYKGLKGFLVTRGTYSYSSSPIHNGFSDVINIAFHFGGGLTYKF